MVEPVPYVFKRLQDRYEGLPGVALANVAVGSDEGRLPFFHLGEVSDPGREGLPEWYDGIGSFSREEVWPIGPTSRTSTSASWRPRSDDAAEHLV